MNRCAYQQDAMAAYEEMRAAASDSVVCPKPRRLGILNPSMNDQIRPSWWQMNRQMEMPDSGAGTELFDIILTKGNYGIDNCNSSVASSPPFFCGSPPSRTSNPLTQDSRFGNNMYSPLSPALVLATSPSSCARMKFGHKPSAAVRIEGFDCLNQDCRSSISAVA